MVRIMAEHNVCIAVLDDHAQAEQAIAALQDAGYDMAQVSLVGKDHPDDKHIHGYYTTGESMKFWGLQGGLYGGLMGVLAGAGFLFVPGLGPLIVGGPLLSTIVGGAMGAGTLGGIEAVFAGLLHLGLSKDSLVLYESKLKAGKCLVLAHGSPEEVVRAKSILETAGGADIALHAD
jgi:hypothetical protein